MKEYVLVIIIVIFLSYGCKGQETPKGTQPKPVRQETKAQSYETAVKEDVTLEKGEEKKTARDNFPPILKSIAVTPQFPQKGDSLKVDVNVTDPDGDNVELIYMWTRNQSSLPENSDTLILTNSFTRGDEIKLTVTPFDGIAKGTPGFMEVTIKNSPPEITSSPNTLIMNDRKVLYQVTAVDPDSDDILTYSLTSEKEEITIDAKSGLLTWNVPDDFMGDVPITISVKDGHDGESIQALTLSIQEEKQNK